jgi:hypothetical protein
MISRRLLEILTASLTGAFGLAVAISSVDNGIGWSSDGVDAGTFPLSSASSSWPPVSTIWDAARSPAET